MKHLVTFLFFVGAIVAYMAGSIPGAAAFSIVGIVLELIGWHRILRGKKRSLGSLR
jgi:hypothetical protein